MAKQKPTIETMLKKATIELLLLNLLNEGDMYGYQLSGELKRRSNGTYCILEGSMYPILYRLTDRGYISFYDKKVGKRQTRVYYHLEEPGRQYLSAQLALYHDYTQAINFIITSKEGDIYKPDQPLSETDETADSI